MVFCRINRTGPCTSDLTASSDADSPIAGTTLFMEIIARTHAAKPSEKVSMIKIKSIPNPSYSDSP
jgi:hypothetical protein